MSKNKGNQEPPIRKIAVNDDLFGNKNPNRGQENIKQNSENSILDKTENAINNVNKVNNKRNKLKKGILAGKATGIGGKTLLQSMALAKAFKTGQSALSMIGNLLNAAKGAIASFFSNIGSAIGGFFGGITSMAQSIFGIGVGAAQALVIFTTVAVLGGSASVIGMGVSTIFFSQSARTDDVIDCKKETQATIDSANANIDADKIAEENAKKIFSIMKSINIPDVNIAGLVGNWVAESGLDPTCVETIYNEPYRIGPRKKRAESLDYMVSQIAPAYGRKWHLIKRVGIGLAQCSDTNDGAVENTEIRNAAKSLNKNWWDFDFQMAFYISKYSKAKWLRSWTKPEASPEAAAYAFAKHFEGNTSEAQSKRKREAAKYFVKFKEMTVDTNYANSIMAMAKTLGTDVNAATATDAIKKCQKAASGADNSSLANAWVSYAYPTQPQGNGNNGTPLYQELHRSIFPGDPYFMSCDRGVATGVRWSGTDDTFPPGPCSAIESYLASSPKWEKVETGGQESNYKPGDVLVMSVTPWGGGHGHILGYTGHEAINAIHGTKAKPTANSVSASFGERSPGCGDVQKAEFQLFRVYRSKSKESNSKYTSLGGGAGSLGSNTPTAVEKNK